MNLMRPSLATLALSALILVSSVSPAVAAEVDQPVHLTTEAVQLAALNARAETSSWVTLSATETQSLLADSESSVRTQSMLELDVSRAEGWAIDRDTTLLKIPVTEYQGAVAPSALMLFLDREGRVTSTVESVFTPTSESSGRVRAWVNGEVQVDQAVGAPVSAPSFGAQPLAALGSSKWWNALNKCLSSQGVPAWIVTGLSIICAAACVVTAGAGCVLCIAAAAGFSSGVVYVCVDYANRA
jgi:hypothetical protein